MFPSIFLGSLSIVGVIKEKVKIKKKVCIMAKNCYMVRINENQFDIIEQKSVVAVGWSKWNFADMKQQDLIEKIGNEYNENGTVPQLRGRKLNEISRFLSIKKGDFILVPHWSSVWLAVADGEYIYDEQAKEADLANQLRVSFLKDKNGDNRCVARSQLSEHLSRRLHLRGATVLDLYDFNDEIEKIFANEEYSISKIAAERENELAKNFKNELLKSICNGDVYLKSGGAGLEELVRELFECEKYEAQILPKQTYKSYGDADISAKSKFINILAQVKHHKGNTGAWGIEQLKEIKKNGEDEGYDKLVLITSGNICEDVQKEAEQNGILTMDGKQLADWIYENVNELSPDTRAKLKISISPHFI